MADKPNTRTSKPEPETAPVEVASEAAADQYDQWIAERRGKRSPFGSVQLKLSHPPIPGFVLRWVNDAGDGLRMSQVIEAGFTFVNGPDGRRIVRRVGVQERGGGLVAYLMKRPEPFSQEDRAALQEKRDALIEQTMTQIKEGQYRKLGADGKPINSVTERPSLK